MNTVIPIPVEETKPPSEKTQAIMDEFTKLHKRLDEFQNVTAEVRQIKSMMQQRESKIEKMIQAARRAVNQFLSQI